MNLKRLVIVAVVWLLTGSSGLVSAASLVVSPASPTPADSITLTSTSIDPVGLWNVGPSMCASVVGDTLVTTLPVDYWCIILFPDITIRYVRTCTFAPLPPGTYVAKYVEWHINACDPTPTETVTTTFTVNEPTPTRLRSWGALKSIYR